MLPPWGWWQLLWATALFLVFSGFSWWTLPGFAAESSPGISETVRGSVPARALRYRRVLTGEARRVFGLGAPVARLAGQIHQESRWDPAAVSQAGAGGLGQFMPATATWFATLHPDDLGEVDRFSPAWAIRALVRYDHYLLSRVKPWYARDMPACDRWAMALAGYVGGSGWVTRDRRAAHAAGADPDLWWGEVEHHTARADWARDQSREYARLILHRWEPLYRAAGWGGEAAC